MKEYADGSSWQRLRRAALCIAASGIVAVTTAHAKPNPSILVVPPAALPELARQSGEALFLHDSNDGKTILYIEQKQGAQLASFDVTDPAHVTSEGSLPLAASGPYDFVAAAGDRAELVRYRQGQGDAILDLHRTPTLKGIRGLELPSPAARPVNDGYTDAAIANAPEVNRALDANRIRATITRADTGTTFVLADNGLYLIRRPAVEMVHQLMIIPPN